MRPIDADNLKKDLDVETIFDSRDRYRVRDLIDIQPTIEAEPVGRGRWIKHLFEREFDICSHCKTGTKRREYGVNDGGKEWVTEYSYKYCPWCGARMEEQE